MYKVRVDLFIFVTLLSIMSKRDKAQLINFIFSFVSHILLMRQLIRNSLSDTLLIANVKCSVLGLLSVCSVRIERLFMIVIIEDTSFL